MMISLKSFCLVPQIRSALLASFSVGCSKMIRPSARSLKVIFHVNLCTDDQVKKMLFSLVVYLKKKYINKKWDVFITYCFNWFLAYYCNSLHFHNTQYTVRTPSVGPRWRKTLLRLRSMSASALCLPTHNGSLSGFKLILKFYCSIWGPKCSHPQTYFWFVNWVCAHWTCRWSLAGYFE